MEDIILLGLGGHAHSVADSMEQAGKYNIIGFLDTEEMQGKRFRDYRVLDTDDALQKYFDKGIENAFVTIGFLGHGDVRNRLYRQLKDIGYKIPNIIDSTAVISRNVVLADGIFIGKKAVINANAQIGEMCIINTGAIVEHDCRIGGFSHIYSSRKHTVRRGVGWRADSDRGKCDRDSGKKNRQQMHYRFWNSSEERCGGLSYGKGLQNDKIAKLNTQLL